MKPNTLREASHQISQLIAKSWLSDDPEATEINAVLQEGNSNNIKTLFQKYGIDLDKLLGETTAVIIDSVFLDRGIEQMSSFDGTLTVKIPYPPKPGDISDEDLTSLVGNSSDRNFSTITYNTCPVSTS